VAARQLSSWFLLRHHQAFATDKTWKTPAADFNTNGDWSPGGVPGSSDRSVFNAAMEVQANLSASLTV